MTEEKMKEKLVVYEALKNTALHCEDGIRNARMCMYTVYFAILAFSFEHHWMFLISFFVLIAFQTMINNDRIAIERISSYIRVFFETKQDGMHWSLINKDEEHLSVYRTQYQNIGWRINLASSSLLAAISFFSLIVTSLHDYRINDFPIMIWLEITVAVLLFTLVIYINRKMYMGSLKDKRTTKALEKSMEDFYKKHYGNPEK